jgi:DNA-binding protein
MRAKCFSVWVGLASLFFAIGAGADMVSDSAIFDKAYIPALALTSQGDAAKSKVAMVRLNQAWGVFSKAYRHDNPGDKTWEKAFVSIDLRIAEADAIVARGEHLADAHEALEQVRIILMELRQEHGMHYFVDYLTAFHEPMEEIVLAAKGKSPATFTEQDLRTIRRAIPKLDIKWNAVRNARFDPKAFGFDATRASKESQLIEAETEAIASLEKALSGSDKGAIIQHATAIKPPFAQLFMLFGEFDAR